MEKVSAQNDNLPDNEEMDLDYRDKVLKIALSYKNSDFGFGDYNIPNFSRSHASAIVDVLFRTASRKVYLYCAELRYANGDNEDGIWGYESVVDSVVRFLATPGREFRVLLAKPVAKDEILRHPLVERVLTEVESYGFKGGRLIIAHAVGEFAEDHETRPPAHFCVNDTGGYRLESSDSKASAEANFSSNEQYWKLVNRFEGQMQLAKHDNKVVLDQMLNNAGGAHQTPELIS